MRLPFLDGIRGLTALYVLLFHAVDIQPSAGDGPSAPIALLQAILQQGRPAVVCFLVVSGFSLMLPVARANDRLVGGYRAFLKRRARRILPPYYAALVLSLAAVLAHTFASTNFGALGAPPTPISVGAIVSHIFLVHTARLDWVYAINGPMWTVATEWQIYLIFPPILLPLFRRLGGIPTIAVCWAIGVLPILLLPPEENYFWASPWFIGVFAMGMWGARTAYGAQRAGEARNLPWGTLSLITLLVIVCGLVTGSFQKLELAWLDLLVAFFTLALILHCTRERAGEEIRIVRLLGSPTLVALGGFSYSLYLIQHPLLEVTKRVVERMPLSYDQVIVTELVIACVAIVPVAWLFSEFFEKPFTTGSWLLRQLNRRRAAAASSARTQVS